ncbi:MAG: NUDIX domain-containing protein [Nitrospirota bacterium]
MATEQFDVLDSTGRKTGTLVGRDDAHAAGVWHGAFHCLVIYGRGGRGYALFQKRAKEKVIAAGKFDVSVGGHYSAGEDARSAGPREISEELGLTIAFPDLVPLGRRVFDYSFAPAVSEHEFQDIFLLPLEKRPGTLVLQAGEVDAVLEMEIGQGAELFSGTIASATGRLTGTNGAETTVSVTIADFVPCEDRYYRRLLQCARRYLQGEREALAI